ncbi:MAG: hypothetical protein R2881_01790 [Eubacteriales bacterium]
MFIPISSLLGVVNLWFMVSFFLVAVLYGTILSVGALLLRKNTLRSIPTSSSFCSSSFIRSSTTSVTGKSTPSTKSSMFGFRKNKSRWGELKRSKFTKKT